MKGKRGNARSFHSVLIIFALLAGFVLLLRVRVCVRNCSSNFKSSQRPKSEERQLIIQEGDENE